jgi:hypothetical protein
MDELDPLQKVELAMLRAEYQKRYQTMIAYLKAKIGEGTEYRNAVARVVISPNGAYYELNDLPEQFMGGVGNSVTYHFVDPAEALALLERAATATAQVDKHNTRAFSILALYSRRGLVDRKNCYSYEFRVEEEAVHPEPAILGAFRPGVMPLFYQIKIDAEYAGEVLQMPRGAVFCISNVGDRSLLVRIPSLGEQVIDLNEIPTSGTIQ